MANNWTKAMLQRYISDGVQEELGLDYKGADALGKTDGKKHEIRKDVSAMANSAGGTLIYGVREFDDENHKHLPEKFDPVDQTVFAREWLEQIIGGIRPRVQNIVITPVPVGPGENDIAFVVDIPASNTAHQSSDWRYYRRYNFSSVPMEDYEIRDVMNRSPHALLDLEFALEFEQRTVTKLPMPSTVYGSIATEILEERYARLTVQARNSGAVYAQYVVAYLYIPKKLTAHLGDDPTFDEQGRVRVRLDNNHRQLSGSRTWQTIATPILPGTVEQLDIELLAWDWAIDEGQPAQIAWEVFADNA